MSERMDCGLTGWMDGCERSIETRRQNKRGQSSSSGRTRWIDLDGLRLVPHAQDRTTTIKSSARHVRDHKFIVDSFIGAGCTSFDK